MHRNKILFNQAIGKRIMSLQLRLFLSQQSLDTSPSFGIGFGLQQLLEMCNVLLEYECPHCR
jgi:hypothetical protein